MKFWILFSRKNKKNMISLSSAEFAHSKGSVKLVLEMYTAWSLSFSTRTSSSCRSD